MSHNPPTTPKTAIETEKIKIYIEFDQETRNIQTAVPEDAKALDIMKIYETVYMDVQFKYNEYVKARGLLDGDPALAKHRMETAMLITHGQIMKKK